MARCAGPPLSETSHPVPVPAFSPERPRGPDDGPEPVGPVRTDGSVSVTASSRRVPAFRLDETFVHLGLGGVTRPLPDFSWAPEFLDRYARETASDGPDGRLVSLLPHTNDWTGWERHPAGEELVVVLSGRVRLVYDEGSGGEVAELGPSEAVINPKGAWHTADVLEAGLALYITPGLGTEHRPRS